MIATNKKVKINLATTKISLYLSTIETKQKYYMRNDLQKVADDVAFKNGYIDLEGFYIDIRDGRVGRWEFEQILSECMQLHGKQIERYYENNCE